MEEKDARNNSRKKYSLYVTKSQKEGKNIEKNHLFWDNSRYYSLNNTIQSQFPHSHFLIPIQY